MRMTVASDIMNFYIVSTCKSTTPHCYQRMLLSLIF